MATYWVSGVAGSGGAGTQASPFLLGDWPRWTYTITGTAPNTNVHTTQGASIAFDNLQPGDTVYLTAAATGGTIDLSSRMQANRADSGSNVIWGATPLVKFRRGGTQAAPITITAAPGESVALWSQYCDQGFFGYTSGTPDATGSWTSAGWITISNLTLHQGGISPSTATISGTAIDVHMLTFGGGPNYGSVFLAGIVVDHCELYLDAPMAVTAQNNSALIGLFQTYGMRASSCVFRDFTWANLSPGHIACVLQFCCSGTQLVDSAMWNVPELIQHKQPPRLGKPWGDGTPDVVARNYINPTPYSSQGIQSGEEGGLAPANRLFQVVALVQDNFFTADFHQASQFPIHMGPCNNGTTIRNNIFSAYLYPQKAGGNPNAALISNDSGLDPSLQDKFPSQQTSFYNNVVLLNSDAGQQTAYPLYCPRTIPNGPAWANQTAPPPGTGASPWARWDCNAYTYVATIRYQFYDVTFASTAALHADPVGAAYEVASQFGRPASDYYSADGNYTPTALTLAGLGMGTIGPDPARVVIGGPGNLLDVAPATRRYGPTGTPPPPPPPPQGSFAGRRSLDPLGARSGSRRPAAC